jgi:hypothetical protein
MNKDYSINFKVGSDTKGLDDLSNKATQAERKFAGLSSSVKGIGSSVGSLAMSVTGLGAALGAVNLANNALSTVKTAKANIIDFQKHSWGSKHAVEFSAFADKMSGDYKIDKDDIFGVMYNATQNRRAFNSDPKQIKEYTEFIAQYSRKTGRDAKDINSQMMKIKKMGNFSNSKMSELMDLITFFQDEYGMQEEESWRALEENWQYLSDNTDPAEFVNLYKDLLEKIGSSSGTDKAIKTLLIKIQEMKKGMSIKDSALGQILDKKGVDVNKFKNLSFPEQTKIIMESVNPKNETDMNLLSEALGTKEALKLQDVELTSLNKEEYKGNIKGELEKVDLNEGPLDKAWSSLKRKGQEFTRAVSGKDTFSLWKGEEEQKLYIESLKNQGLYQHQIDAELQKKFRQDIQNINTNTNIENTYNIYEATDVEKVKKVVDSSNNETFHVLNNTLKERNNLK